MQKKIDNRIRVLIENGVKLNQRTLLIIIGDNGKDQVNSCKRDGYWIDPQFALHTLKVAYPCSSFCLMVL